MKGVLACSLAGVLIGLVVLVVILITWDTGEEAPKPTFATVQAAANAACGNNLTIDVEYDGGSWSRLARFITTCEKADGNVYVVVNKVPE